MASGVPPSRSIRSSSKAIVLVAGANSGDSQKRFYKQLIATADRRFSAHLQRLKAATKKGVCSAGDISRRDRAR
jgi:hypothetical protein